MYEVDSTEGYVLGYYNQGEADRRYRVLTREHGVIYARATSVRLEKSKLKHCLQKLNLIEIETIQSRIGYQITGGRLIHNPLRQGLTMEQLGVLDRIGQLIGRLSQNPETDSKLFDIFEQIINQLHNFRGLASEIEVAELWGTARVLIEFGYFDPAFSSDIDLQIFSTSTLDAVSRDMLHTHKMQLERYINQCIDQTML